MNLDLPSLPPSCDVLVVGAGPAGSACAIELCQAGYQVVLVDQHRFPRDKICGDALIPDAHAALERLGLLRSVMAHAQTVSHVRCVAPRGGQVDVPGTLAVLPRRVLDELLCQAAVQEGAHMVAPAKFTEVLKHDGTITGARLCAQDQARDIQARWVVLATGAVPQALIAAGMCEQQLPSGTALRGYVHNTTMASTLSKLDIVWHRALSPGYGWVFPCGNDLYNIGAGIAHSHQTRTQRGQPVKKNQANLRDIFDTFIRLYPPAAALIETGQLQGPLKGAPLRCSLQGARATQPGLLVTGEAVGSTYSFTGEGIGKALHTGMLAAQAIASNQNVCTTYEASLAALIPRFNLYERANRVNAYPWLMDLLIWRAKNNHALLKRMSGVLNETSNPGHLASLRGVMRLLLPS